MKTQIIVTAKVVGGGVQHYGPFETLADAGRLIDDFKAAGVQALAEGLKAPECGAAVATWLRLENLAGGR